jgi:hypothetical protein
VYVSRQGYLVVLGIERCFRLLVIFSFRVQLHGLPPFQDLAFMINERFTMQIVYYGLLGFIQDINTSKNVLFINMRG